MEKEEVDFQASEWYQRASCSRRDTVEEVASVLFQSAVETIVKLQAVGCATIINFGPFCQKVAVNKHY